MSKPQIAEGSLISDPSVTIQHTFQRILILSILLFLSITLYILLIFVTPPADGPVLPMLPVWLLNFLPYLVACSYVLATRRLQGRPYWIELGLIFTGALIFRAMLVPLQPALSRDIWRYLLDAHLTAHGYSPYVYVPNDPALQSIHNTLFDDARFRGVPTVYPPAAEGIFLLVYLIAPNVIALKGLFLVFDLLTCSVLAILLKRNGLDPRRAIIYAWCPLPVVEFALQGHMDVVVIMFSLLAVLCATSNRRGMRILTGFFIALGTLTKFYPILLLIVLTRRRDWALLFTCFATIVIAYIPFIVMGHGQVLGFFFTYESEQGSNAGIVQLITRWISYELNLGQAAMLLLERVVNLLIIGVVASTVLLFRLRKQISIEVAILVLVGTILATSPHIFPWYPTGLLPWIAMAISPLLAKKRLSGKGIAILTVWSFIFTVLFSYLPRMSVFDTTPIWSGYYAISYGTVLAGLVIATLVGMRWLPVFRL